MRMVHRAGIAVLALLAVLSGLVAVTLGWQSLNQQATNETRGGTTGYARVELVKLEKAADGTETEIPVPGAVFALFTAEGEQIGGLYTTDSDGRISVQLEPGEYYFEEISPAPGFTFDKDGAGQPITRYYFEITGAETEQITVTAYNGRLYGALTITKTVQNEDGAELTEAQLEQTFAFTVTFSDGGAYAYRIDGGEPRWLESGGTIYLKHGQAAVFENIPVGVLYTVTETPVPGYTVSSTAATGNITGEGCAAAFTNTYGLEETGEPAKIIVTKELKGEYPAEDTDKEFHFTLIVDGENGKVEEEFTLKPGETAEFEVSAGAYYEVREDNYYGDGYSLSMTNSAGTALPGQTVTVTATNTYVGEVQVEIEGEKTWVLGEYGESVLPETITVRLKNGSLTVQEITVSPDENGEWHYTFTAPKYNANGEEIIYTVEEAPLDRFTPAYDGYDIENTYTPDAPPVTEDGPGIEKRVAGSGAPAVEFSFLLRGRDGAPMPAGSDGDAKVITITGSGSVGLGTFTFEEAGTYTYTISELNTGAAGWTYDNAIYTLTFTVTEEDGALHASYTLAGADGQPVDAARFTNRYDGDEPEPDDPPDPGTPPVTEDGPDIEKRVTGRNAPETEFSFLLRGESGAPMPAGSTGRTKVITITGSGSAGLGTFTFRRPGTYTYTISELNTGGENWAYDSAVYTLTFTVTRRSGALRVSYTLTDAGGDPVDAALFVNSYEEDEPETVVVAGVKTWEHGDNTEESRPDSIIVRVYADGELAAQRLVTAANGWRYAFELPRYAEDGHEIVYTIDEAAVPGYEKEVDGYDLTNTYVPDEPVPDTPDKPGPEPLPQTGQLNWPVPILAGLGVLSLLWGWRLRRYVGKRVKHGKKKT